MYESNIPSNLSNITTRRVAVVSTAVTIAGGLSFVYYRAIFRKWGWKGVAISLAVVTAEHTIKVIAKQLTAPQAV